MSLPPSVQKLITAIDAGNVSVAEVPTAIRQAGGEDFVLISVIRELAAGSGAAAFADITGSASDNASLVAYVTSRVAGLLDFKGNTDCSSNPNYPSALKGDVYMVSVAGKIGGASGKIVEVGDMYVANADNAGGTEASVGTSWFVLQANITGITAAGLVIMRAADAAAQRTALSLGTLALQDASAVAITGGTIAGLTGFALRDTSAAFDVTLAAVSSATLTAGRIVTLDVGNAAQTLKFTAASTVTFPAGTNTLATLGANTFTALQTITQAAANAGIIASTGYSLTGSNATNGIDVAGTWNTSGAPVGLKFNITNTASGATARLFDFQVGGTTALALKVDGSIVSGTAGGGYFIADSTNTGLYNFSSSAIGIVMSGVTKYGFGSAAFAIDASNYLAWDGSPFTPDSGGDLYLGRTAAATLTMGLRGSATPVAQIFGTTAGAGADITGANLTIIAGNGTGAGGSGSLLFQTAPVAGSSSTVNTLATRLTIDNAGKVAVASGGAFQLGNAATTGLIAGALSALTTASIVIYDSTGTAYRVPCVV